VLTQSLCDNCGSIIWKQPATLRRYEKHFCNRKCQVEFYHNDRHPQWKGGCAPYSYRQFLKEKCERCPSKISLLIHHKDKDRKNNTPKNLETLCLSCHQKKHEVEKNFKNAYKGLERNKHGRFQKKH